MSNPEGVVPSPSGRGNQAVKSSAEYKRAWRLSNHERVLSVERDYRNRLRAEGRLLWNARNPDRAQENKRAWRKRNPEQRERACWAEILRNHGVTREQYESMLASQNGVCAICQQPNAINRRLHVDHDHNSGKVRGLLCTNCNPMLGFAKDNKEVLRAAIAYLENNL